MISVKRYLLGLAYLAACVGVLPVLVFLPWWVQAALLGGGLTGIVCDRRQRYFLSALPATLLSVVFFLLFLLQVTRANLVAPLIELLCLLLAVRLATTKSPRNILQLFLLATIILAASSLLTLDMGFLVYLVLMVFLVTSGLLLLSFYATDQQLVFRPQQWRLLYKVMLLMPVGSLLLMLLLFVVLPRTQQPLWNFLNPKPTATIGMTDQVRPGSVTELAQSSRTAFRVETDRLPADSLYWRGVVLNRLEGNSWQRSPDLAREELAPSSGQERQLDFYSEPKADRYLVTLDQPQRIEGVRHELSADGVVTGRLPPGRKLNYRVTVQQPAHRKQLGALEPYLSLPGPLSKRLQEVGKKIAEQPDYRAKVAHLEDFFTAQQLSYSSRQLPLSVDPIDSFLFESKRGYCEYFASSFALLLRSGGVPARLVGGYLGGEYNPLGGYYQVGEDLAHVWVEALDDQGYWQRLDPSRLAINAEQAFLQSRRQNLTSLRAVSDALLHYWSRMVLNYDLHQQIGLLRQVARQVRDIKSLTAHSFVPLAWLIPLVLLVFLIFYLKRRPSRELRLVRAYRQQLFRCTGENCVNHLGMFAIARKAAEPLCCEFAEIYGRSIYRDLGLPNADYRRLRQIVRQLGGRKFSIEVAIPQPVGDNTELRN